MYNSFLPTRLRKLILQRRFLHTDSGSHIRARSVQLFRKGGVLHGEDLHGQQRGVDGAVNGDGRHRNARRHLYRGQQCVHSAKIGRFHRDTDNRKRGACGQRTGKVRGLACRSQNHAEAVPPRFRREPSGFSRCAVRAHNMHFRRYTVARQRIQRLPDNRKVAVAPHNDRNFFHNFPNASCFPAPAAIRQNKSVVPFTLRFYSDCTRQRLQLLRYTRKSGR